MHLILHPRHQHLNQMIIMAKLKQRRQQRSRMHPTKISPKNHKKSCPGVAEEIGRRYLSPCYQTVFRTFQSDSTSELHVSQEEKERGATNWSTRYPHRPVRSHQHPCQPLQTQKSGLILISAHRLPRLTWGSPGVRPSPSTSHWKSRQIGRS